MAASTDIDKKNRSSDGSGVKEKDDEEAEVVLDLSGRKLKKLERAPVNQRYATALVLDNNQLQNLGNLDSYGELERLSIANNEIVRMHWFGRMYSIRILNLPNNNIVQMEALRELHHLLHLNLSGNHIKAIEGLSNSYKMEHLNLSGNNIAQLSDVSVLKNLKELFLHRNHIESLQRCTKLLPSSLLILTLSDNFIADLNELSNLSHLAKLEQITVLNNPCLEPLHILDNNGDSSEVPCPFDYRPFVINWCLNLRVLDGYKVTPKESLKGEWLYSQGKGRSYPVGEHPALVQYLSNICPVGGGWGGADLPDDEAKLTKVLELVKQHQQDLRNKPADDNDKSETPRTPRMPRSTPPSQRKYMIRSAPQRRNTGPQRIPKTARDVHRRAKSYSAYGTSGTSKQSAAEVVQRSYNVELASTLYGSDLRTPDTPGLMTQSMDPALLSQLAYSDQSHGNMSLSLGPDQLSRSLLDQGTPCSAKGTSYSAQASPFSTDVMNQSLCPDQLQRSLGNSQELDCRVNHRDCDGFSGRGAKSLSSQSSLEGTPTSRPASQKTLTHSANNHDMRPSSADSRQNRTTQSGLNSSASQRPRSSSLKSPTPYNMSRSSGPGDMSPKMRHSPKVTPHSQPPAMIQSSNERIGYSSLNRKSTRRYSQESDSSSKILNSRNSTKVIPQEQTVTRAEEAATTIQRYWRGFSARQNNCKVRAIREHIRHSRAEQHIRHLSEKLRRTEVALEKEKRLRRLQLDAIRTLWREIQKMQSRKDGVNTPSTPMTPLTPITPLERSEKAPNKPPKLYSEESVNELTEFCKSLEGQVKKLENSLSYVNQVTSYLCHLPGAQQLLANLPEARSLLATLQSSVSKDAGQDAASGGESIETFTNSIVAMTTLLSMGGKLATSQETDKVPPDADSSDPTQSRTNGPTRPSSLAVTRLSRQS